MQIGKFTIAIVTAAAALAMTTAEKITLPF